jgi:hypothetical protein
LVIACAIEKPALAPGSEGTRVREEISRRIAKNRTWHESCIDWSPDGCRLRVSVMFVHCFGRLWCPACTGEPHTDSCV